MKPSHLGQILMLILSLCSLAIALTIEYQNAKANHYLPRHDSEPAITWRVSRFNTPTDRLRGLVGSISLMQYLLAPCAIILAGYQLLRPNQTPLPRIIATLCAISAIYSIILALYRGYFTSLGW